MSRSPVLRTSAAALVIGCALALTACSGGEKPAETSATAPSAPAASSATKPAGQVYDFQAQSVPSRDGVRVELPKKLREASPDAAQSPVTALTVTAHDVGDPDYCGVHVQIEYSDGGYEKVSAPVPEETDPFTHATQKAIPSGPGAVSRRLASESRSLPLSQLTTKDRLVSTFVSEDGQEIVKVAECSESEFSSSDDVGFYFPKADGTYGIASIEVTVMKNGTITVRKGEVSDYKLDSTGEWIKK